MSKKILAVALAAAMILGLASVAFAGFSDTAGHTRETAIQRLYGLGLIDGFGDGTFRPEESITRAQIAKMIVYAMGLKDAADMLSGVPVGFSDVAVNHWASGYISIASSQGIVLGYPDGTFKPEQNVTYAEILTMILRAIGYGPVLSNLPWPTGYITKAAELKINKGINFLSNAYASRGDVCGLLANALTVPKLIQTGYGDSQQYVVSGTSGTTAVFLLTDMGATYEDGYLVSAPDLFANKGTSVQLDGKTARNLADGYTVSGLLGHLVRTWVNDEGEVFFVEDITPETAIEEADSVVDSNTVELEDGTQLDVPANMLFRNYVRMNPNLTSSDTVTVILEAGVIKAAIVNTYTWGVVDTVNLNYERINFDGTNGSAALTLKDYDIVWDGAASSLEELEENDVIEYIRSINDKKAVFIVTRNSVVGEFSKLSGSSATVDGTAYTALGSAVGVATEKLGGDVEILLNKDGKIVKMVALTTPAASGTLAVVLDEGTGTDGFDTVQKVKLWLLDDSEVVLDLAGKLTYDGTANTADTAVIGAINPGDVITYKTNSSGKINNITLEVDYDLVTDTLTINKKLSLVNSTKVTADTVVINLVTDTDTGLFDGAEALTTETLLGITIPTGGLNSKVVGTGATADIVVVIDAPAVESDTLYGMVYGSYQAKIGSSVETVLRILVEGTITDYPAGSASFSKKTVVSFKESDGDATSVQNLATYTGDKIAFIDDTTDSVYKYRVTDIDLVNSVVTLEQVNDEGVVKSGTTPTYLWLNADTLYYDASGTPASLAAEDVAKDAIVDVYYNTDTDVVVVLVVTGY